MSKCSFQNDWIANPKFYWLQEVSNNKNMCYCTLCNIKFSLSNMGLRAVTSHQKGKKHQQKEMNSTASKSIKNIFSCEKTFPSTSASGNELGDISVAQQSQTEAQSCECKGSHSDKEKFIKGSKVPSTIEKYLFKDDVTKTEIMWCLEAIMTHRSLRSAEKDVKMFPKLFPDSEIAKNMQLGRDKMAYTIVYGIAPFFKESLTEEILMCDHFVLGFDESLNKVSQKQQMDINVRYWCSISNEVKTRYLNSAFLGRSCSTDLLTAFHEATKPLNLKKLLQVSMDGPNVNKKFFRELSCLIKETPEDPEILNLGSCGLHAINVAFKTGVKCTGWNIMEFNRALYYLFRDSPARRSLYISYTNSNLFPQKFCSVRWLENACVAERCLTMIPHLKVFVDKVEKNNIAPSSKSYMIVKKAINDPLLPAKLAFFHSMASEIESFLKEYQTDTPLIPFLYSDLTNCMRRLMECFIQKDLLKKNVMEIDLEDEKSFLSYRQIDVGISALHNLKKYSVSESDLILFRKDCRSFLIKCVNKLQERSPLIYELTKAVSCLDPKVTLNPNLFSSRLTKLLLILCQKNWISTTVAERVKSQFKGICLQPHIITKLKLYKRSERIDNFWYSILSSEQNSLDDAIYVIKIVMILSHGNSNVERGFSINKDCLWDNMKEESLIGRRIVYDSILAKGGLNNFQVSKQMIHMAKNSRAKFAEESERRHKEEKEKIELSKRKRVVEMDIKRLEAKKSKILEEASKESHKIEEEIAALRYL